MKKLLAAILYTGLVALANPALADLAKAEAMRDGDMKKLTFHSTPQAAGTAEFTTFDGEPISLADAVRIAARIRRRQFRGRDPRHRS